MLWNRNKFPFVKNASILGDTDLSATVKSKLNCSASLSFYRNGTYMDMNSSISILGKNKIYQENEYVLNNSGIFVCEKEAWIDINDIRVLTTIVTFTISVTCLIIAFIIHICTKTYRSTHDKCMMSFSAALFFAQGASLVPHLTTNFCKANAVLLQYLWLTVFTWTSVMAFDLAYTFSICRISYLRSTDSKKLFRKYSLFGWLLPLAVVLVCVLLDQFEESVNFGYGSRGHCWITNKIAVYISTTTPIVICLIFNFVCIGISMFGIEYVKKQSLNVKKNTKDAARCTVYLQISLLLGVTWILAFIIIAFPFLWLQVMHNIINGCQGVYVLVMTLKHPKVIKGISRRMQKYKLSYSKTKSTTLTSSTPNKPINRLNRSHSI
ncbi:probable G-protein coupled receptor Mth-like 3 [Saccostrea echinata]|uniref:probable G-protein coupled receptor Mth-like 3 n=1 Tax=Saccostrea echinata TaxID=191078 RepID=UPI002A7EDE39|nr:probable G-protein coupled receptor Mth-like 3 [Saccostrea echinata]